MSYFGGETFKSFLDLYNANRELSKIFFSLLVQSSFVFVFTYTYEKE